MAQQRSLMDGGSWTTMDKVLAKITEKAPKPGNLVSEPVDPNTPSPAVLTVTELANTHNADPRPHRKGETYRKDFEAFLLVLYPEDFEGHDLSYEQWKSVLHLSTRWEFASLRKLAMKSIKPPTPYDQLLLTCAYAVDNWVLPALSALCTRAMPVTLKEALK
ncbi:hypothetical protein BJV78DRAFT_102259 [Lactifluus subvellereus]|nr:hypothetical protein BJV78DRAFT_1381363 [Lactifluus subvellereus]KAI0254023.1 hypothetical protein BJV78DRAFT_102259 [Lactifluus subvellereus]